MIDFELVRWININELNQNGYSSNISQVPTPFVIDDKIFIYLAGREENNQSYVSLLITDINFEIIEIKERVFTKSLKLGTFDDEGVMPGYVMQDEIGRYLMFYSGWNSRNTVPYHNATGVCASRDLINWERLYDGPILDRTALEPYLAVTPWVEKIKDKYHMLYISGLGYKEINGTQEPIYTIKYATSKNIVSWFRQSNPLIELKDDEGSPICFSHPTFIKINSKEWLVLSCSRGINDYRYGKQGYNLVYWVTKNLTTLEGIKEIDIKHNLSTIEAKKYHQSMQAYPSLFWLNQKLYCTFNGNRFGRTGFGIARVNIKTKNE